MNYSATGLSPHPEGGRFREVFRSPLDVELSTGKKRSALTHIYFALNQGECSRFHRVCHDEIWNLYQGLSLKLWIMGPGDSGPQLVELSPASRTFCAVVPAGFWQAAEAVNNDVLVGCSVAPGFDFEDFELISDEHPEAQILRDQGFAHLVDLCP
ncbi:MAG: cupin domain-containing protein [Kiritimatiellia bacterium]